MPEDNLTPENINEAANAANDAINAAEAAAAEVGEAATQAAPEAHSALDQLADALADSTPATPAATDASPFSSPNEQVAPFEATSVLPTSNAPETDAVRAPETDAFAAQPQVDATQAGYTQPTQVIDQNPQPVYGQPTQPTDPSQPAYGAPVYGQPAAPQYAQGSNPGTTPMVLGILSIVFAGLIGLILSIIGLKKSGPVLAADPNNGRAKAGKITSIIGLILSILALIATIAMIVGLFALGATATENPEALIEPLEQIAATDETGELQSQVDELKQELGMTENSASADAGAGAAGAGAAGSYEPTAADEAAAAAAVEAELSVLSNPSDAEYKAVADELASSFESGAGFPLEEMGLTADEFAKWMLTDFAYETKETVLLSDETGWVELKATSRDFSDFSMKFNEGIDAFLESGTQLDDESQVYSKLGEIMREAMDKTGMTEKNIYVDVAHENGNWVVDEQSLEYAIMDIFSLY